LITIFVLASTVGGAPLAQVWDAGKLKDAAGERLRARIART
jgi:hypothetical protein